MCLREYEDILPVRDVYCLLALVSSSAGAFGVCSRAFIKLEGLAGGDEYEELATELFVKWGAYAYCVCMHMQFAY